MSRATRKQLQPHETGVVDRNGLLSNYFKEGRGVMGAPASTEVACCSYFRVATNVPD
jgi:hypothetical protein